MDDLVQAGDRGATDVGPGHRPGERVTAQPFDSLDLVTVVRDLRDSDDPSPDDLTAVCDEFGRLFHRICRDGDIDRLLVATHHNLNQPTARLAFNSHLFELLLNH